MISQVKKKDFLPKNDQIWPKIGIFGWYGPGHAGFFGALLVGQLVVVAHGLYLARHLFTLCITKWCKTNYRFLLACPDWHFHERHRLALLLLCSRSDFLSPFCLRLCYISNTLKANVSFGPTHALFLRIAEHWYNRSHWELPQDRKVLPFVTRWEGKACRRAVDFCGRFWRSDQPSPC